MFSRLVMLLLSGRGGNSCRCMVLCLTLAISTTITTSLLPNQPAHPLRIQRKPGSLCRGLS
ncbi:hypothetical protein HS088_TW01G00263 [Tripterygium wilfordii]|uniref:Uncharacterized protein n=1 Tax=Tripterygium wilfordii TaxID=458696 RepID=A0A7J7E161_TRIWF|nr:hypothetical protein HS088_TW01G00263 [Tripterygium wilfordii]